jgi:hypothetical protein
MPSRAVWAEILEEDESGLLGLLNAVVGLSLAETLLSQAFA